MVEFLNEHRTLWEAVLGSLIVITLIWVLKKTLNRSILFIKYSREFLEKIDKQAATAENRARYRDIFISQSIVISLLNFFNGFVATILGVSTAIRADVFMVKRIIEGNQDGYHFYITIVSGAMLAFGLVHILYGVFILQKAQNVLEVWKINLDKEND